MMAEMTEDRPNAAMVLAAREWARTARLALERDRYWYQPDFADPSCGREATGWLAEELGQVLDDVIVTCPTVDAPRHRPFDQRAVLGWHDCLP